MKSVFVKKQNKKICDKYIRALVKKIKEKLKQQQFDMNYPIYLHNSCFHNIALQLSPIF